jgi:CRISPR-associated endonuclease Cas1/CRISPR-associated protein Cas4
MSPLDQPELPLPAPPLPDDQPLLPARMVNEFQYCPRLAYLEWVQGEWADSADTVEGRHIHRHVDTDGPDALPEPDALDPEERLHARSVTLSSRTLGVIAKLDLIESAPGADSSAAVVPVDYKHGRRPHVAAGAHEPERIQLCLQGLLLAEHGYTCTEGVLYFRESRERVRVPFDPALRLAARAAVTGLRLATASGRIPPPTEDGRKCPRCSLVGICLPDEVLALTCPDAAPRPLVAAIETALPVYVQAGHGRIGKKGETLEIALDDKPAARARLGEVSQLAVFGNVGITTPCLHELMRRDIPVTWLSHGGWFLGHTVGTGHKNVELRTAQYRASFDEAFCLRFARGLVAAKIRNARTLLRRNWRGEAPPANTLEALKRHEREAGRVPGLPELLGVEGAAAAAYFGRFAGMVKPPAAEAAPGLAFDFTHRNRRPPADPVNALLSFAYALLVRSLTVALTAIGFDAYRGFFHQPRYGRPALALDMMEPFRPLLADSVVLTVINNGEVTPRDFTRAAGACALNEPGRKALIAAFERRMEQEITHPVFGYTISYRRLLEVQARLLGRHLMGEIDTLPHVTPR